MLIELIFLLIGFAYFLLIASFIFGWHNIKVLKYDEVEYIPVSIVIAMRNEGHNIKNLLESLIKQDYPTDCFEIILVDDHSTDDAEEKVGEYQKEFKNIKYHKLEGGQGKKSALAYGISKSLNNYILTSDADCEFSASWIRSIVACFSKNNADVIIGPVLMANTKGIFQKMQELEFMSLIASTAGAAGLKHPIMANGANLAFKKQAYNAIKANMAEPTASGDDVFLIHEAKKKSFKIAYLKEPVSYVVTKPAATIKNFIQQRKRWVSKSKYYTDHATILVSFIVLMINGSILASFLLSLIKLSYLYVALILLIIKLTMDLILFINFLKYYKKTKLLIYFIPLQIIYPIYILFISIIGLLGNFKWKERNY